MNIHFLGGSDEVGASCILLELGGQRILVDAGIRVSPKARDGLPGELLPDLSPLNVGKLDAVIITHAHADHIGAIPLVLGSLPDTPVYTTPATMSLMSVMFRDALRIMDSRLEAEGELPTYDVLQVQRVENAARPTDLRQEFSINGAVNVTFYRAGHIPGAVSVFLQADEGTVLVSGDLSFSPMRATPEAEIPPVKPDALILETTYGGRLHANRRAEEQRLIDSVSRVIERGGRVLIPAFALGRAQEVALILDHAIQKKKLPAVPVYLDGMTRSITQVFERFPDYLSRELTKHLEDNLNLFRTDAVQFVQSRQQREELAMNLSPSVVISSSGMLTGGASPYYAQYVVKDPNSAIFITGYQDEESPGRLLQNLAAEGGGTITLYGKKFQVECEIGTYSLSAHADENELTQFAAQLEPDRVFLVHGDPMARERMRDLLRQRKLSVYLPRLGEMVKYEGTAISGRRKDVPQTPTVITPPITSLDELDLRLPLYNAEGELYVANAKKPSANCCRRRRAYAKWPSTKTSKRSS
jgi:Cft2 family RNA processing exonuclease